MSNRICSRIKDRIRSRINTRIRSGIRSEINKRISSGISCRISTGISCRISSRISSRDSSRISDIIMSINMFLLMSSSFQQETELYGTTWLCITEFPVISVSCDQTVEGVTPLLNSVGQLTDDVSHFFIFAF